MKTSIPSARILEKHGPLVIPFLLGVVAACLPLFAAAAEFELGGTQGSIKTDLTLVLLCQIPHQLDAARVMACIR